MKYTQPLNEVEDAGYVNGNPAIAATGSIIAAGALENPQREIVNAIAAAGITPSASSNSQLAQAISAQISTATDGLQTQINAKAANNAVVKLTGNQTISGTKTFSASPLVPNVDAGDNSTKAANTAFVTAIKNDLQTQINTKAGNITGAATTITSNNLTASRALVSNGSGKVAVSSTTSTELGYVHGVTSAIQTQLNSKAGLSSNNNFTGTSNQFVTPELTDKSQKPATTEWVRDWVDANTVSIHSVVQTYISGKNWYRVYDDKWVEQGGEIDCTESWKSLNFLKQFADTNYTILGSCGNNNNGAMTAPATGSGAYAAFMSLSTTGCKVQTSDDGTFNNAYCRWYACGYGV